MNKHFAELVRRSELLELVSPPSYALSVFRMRQLPPGVSKDITQDSLTRQLYEQLSARKDLILTQTTLNGMFCIRFAVGAARTEVSHIEGAFAIICDEAHQITAGYDDHN